MKNNNESANEKSKKVMKNEQIRSRLEYRNGSPILMLEIDNQALVTMTFATTKSETDVKSAILEILTAQYENKLQETKPKQGSTCRM